MFLSPILLDKDADNVATYDNISWERTYVCWNEDLQSPADLAHLARKGDSKETCCNQDVYPKCVPKISHSEALIASIS